jgi:hypothetical protein
MIHNNIVLHTKAGLTAIRAERGGIGKMTIEYRILFHKGNVILAENKNDYIVGIDYDETQPKGSQWGHGLYFSKTVEGL